MVATAWLRAAASLIRAPNRPRLVEDEELEGLRRLRREELLRRLPPEPAPQPVAGPMGDFEAYLRAQPLAMVDFWAEWCGPCRTMAPLVEQLARAWAGRVAVAKVNVDAYPELAERYRVASIPTFLFFKDSRVAGRLVGARPRADFERVVESLAEETRRA